MGFRHLMSKPLTGRTRTFTVNTSDLAPLPEAPKRTVKTKDVRPSWLAGARLSRSK